MVPGLPSTVRAVIEPGTTSAPIRPCCNAILALPMTRGVEPDLGFATRTRTSMSVAEIREIREMLRTLELAGATCRMSGCDGRRNGSKRDSPVEPAQAPRHVRPPTGRKATPRVLYN